MKGEILWCAVGEFLMHGHTACNNHRLVFFVCLAHSDFSSSISISWTSLTLCTAVQAAVVTRRPVLLTLLSLSLSHADFNSTISASITRWFSLIITHKNLSQETVSSSLVPHKGAPNYSLHCMIDYLSVLCRCVVNEQKTVDQHLLFSDHTHTLTHSLLSTTHIAFSQISLIVSRWLFNAALLFSCGIHVRYSVTETFSGLFMRQLTFVYMSEPTCERITEIHC